MVAMAGCPACAMNHAQPHAANAAPLSAAGRWLADWTPAPAGMASGNPSAQDGAFIALQNAYRPHRGLLRLRCRAADAGSRREEPARDVADLVDAGALFGFPWYDAIWIPMFQFDVPGPGSASGPGPGPGPGSGSGPGPALATGPQRVVAELAGCFEGWALASWFVRPSTWLAGSPPIACLGSRLPEVLQAARADRFVVRG